MLCQASSVGAEDGKCYRLSLPFMPPASLGSWLLFCDFCLVLGWMAVTGFTVLCGAVAPPREKGVLHSAKGVLVTGSSAGRWYFQALTYHVEGQPEAEHLLRATVVYLPSLLLAHGRLFCALELVVASEAPRLLLSSTARTRHGWAEVDITPYLVLGNSSMETLRLRHVCVHAGRAGGHDVLVAPGHPFLLLYLNDTQAGLAPPAAEPHRHRRDTGTLAHDLPSYLREQGGEKSDCSLRPFPVSFAQLGWDHWIIAPHRYNPRYCKGTCPHLLRYDYHAPNHAVVQSFVHQLVDANVPRPSCVPYRYSPISVLMIERNGGILYKEYENMIAESCTCR